MQPRRWSKLKFILFIHAAFPCVSLVHQPPMTSSNLLLSPLVAVHDNDFLSIFHHLLIELIFFPRH